MQKNDKAGSTGTGPISSDPQPTTVQETQRRPAQHPVFQRLIHTVGVVDPPLAERRKKRTVWKNDGNKR